MKINVITVSGVPRNNELIKLDLVHLISGIDGRVSGFQIPSTINQDSNQIILGTRLSNSQAAAVLSHRLAQISFDENWCCVLEDDAVILDLQKFYEGLNEIEKLRTKKPTIVLLYAGFGGVVGKTLRIGKNFSLADVLSLPTGAVAYALNAQARNLISNQTTISGVPDWPTWVSSMKMYSLVPNTVSHDPGQVSLYSANMPRDFSSFWPKYRKLSPQSILGLLNKKISKAHGGKRSYFRLVVKTGVHRATSQIRSSIRFR